MTEFDDGKDDGALRTIGEVSEALGIKSLMFSALLGTAIPAAQAIEAQRRAALLPPERYRHGRDD